MLVGNEGQEQWVASFWSTCGCVQWYQVVKTVDGET